MSARIATALTVALPLFVVSAHSHAQLKVGVVAAMTGPAGILGGEMMASVETTRQTYALKLETILCDTESNLAKARDCIARLHEQDKVQAIIGMALPTEQAAALGPARDAKIPVISFAAVPMLRTERPANMFRLRGSRGNAFSVARRFIVQDLKPQRLAVLGDASARLSTGADWKTAFPGANVVLQSRSFDEAANPLKTAAPQAIFVDAFPVGNVQALTQNVPGATIVTYTTGSIDLYRELNSARVFVAAPPKYPTEAARKLWDAHLRRDPPAAAQGLLLYVAAALQILQATAKPQAIDPRDIARGTFTTVLGKIRFAESNGDAKGEGTGSVVYSSSNTASAHTSTGSQSCTCTDKDCCRTECCENNGCNAAENKCKDVSCSN